MAKSEFCNLWFEPATRKVNDELYSVLTNSCWPDAWQAAEAMTLRNTGLVVYKVDLFLAFYPAAAHLRDDLNSAGLLGLTEAVMKMVADGYVANANPTGLMSFYVLKHISDTVEREETIRVPRRTREEHPEIPIPVMVPIDKVPADIFSYDPRPLENLWQTIESCCEGDLELSIVRLRAEGRADREIAAKLGVPLTSVFIMRREIYARFLKATGMAGTP